MEPTTPRIAACLITKDSAATIRPAIDSIRPFVDGIFVYDTGSTDGTVELLENLNQQPDLWADPTTGQVLPADTPREDGQPPLVQVPLAPIVVERGEWRDDFAWARQQSFDMVPDEFDWHLWCDDDDVVEGAHHLRQLAATARPDLDGYIFMYDYARDEAGNCVCVLWRERLLRRTAGYRWINPIHEVLVPPDRPANLAPIPPNHVRYVHHRPTTDRYSPDRNLRILRALEAKHIEAGEPVPPRDLAYLGTELMAKGQFAEAAGYLQRYVESDASWGDERSQVYHKLAMCLRVMGNPRAAVDVEMTALRERDDWAENAVGLSQAFADLGEWPRAILWAERALQQGAPQTPLIVNPMEFTLLPWLTIADGAAKTGQDDRAAAALQQALQVAPTNPHVRAKAAQVGALLAQNEVAAAVHKLREALVRHDENLKAHMLLEHAVPYFLSDRPDIVKARADQREMVAHYLRPDEYDRWYREEPKESTVPNDKIPEIGEFIPRAQRLLEGLLEQEKGLGRKPRLLDLGANDMWMAAFLWINGQIEVDGVELNKQAVAKADTRFDEFKMPGRLWHGNLFEAPSLTGGRKYDAVSLFEVLEHVPDVDEALDLMESLLKPDGVIYISTPNGAYERGNIPEWARVERKGHLRAIPISELVDRLAARGTIVASETQHADRVSFVAYQPAPRKQRIVFYAGGSWEPWSPASIDTTGLGGSETALVQVAVRLGMEGHRVTVYSGAEPGFYGGVMFRPFTAWDPTDDPDLLVVSRVAHVFDNPIGASKTALWCHDHSYDGSLTEERIAKIDHVVVLSDWQRERFAARYPFAADKLTLIRNGIAAFRSDGTDRYPDRHRPFSERQPRVVYSSSADRGLDVLVTLWPSVRERVPDAELHVFYGWDVLDRVAVTNPALLVYKQRVLALVAQAGGEDAGIFMRGRVGQLELAAEMQTARVWGYPTAFLETSCIGAMEARRAGLAIVTSDLGALRESVGHDHGLLIPWDTVETNPTNADPGYQSTFVDAVCDALTNADGAWDDLHDRALDGTDQLDWKHRVPAWEALLPPVEHQSKRRRRRLKKAKAA